MTPQEIDALLERQRAFFAQGKTLDVNYRINALKKLYQAVSQREDDIARALQADLGKSPDESYICETGQTLSEIRYLLAHIRRYTREQTVPTPLTQFHARSYRKPCPYGMCLIMSPWNYPVLLTLEPLADALAAGNTAVIKPSAYAPATSRLLKELIQEIFPEEYVAVVTGGRVENGWLLERKFDYIFFTGSKAVGRLVLEKAAAHLTPVTLELGGKSPCIVHSSADIPLAARRIVFGKFLNCGQTCVAPDYILCHQSVKEELMRCLKAEITRQYGAHPLENPAYGRLISRKHFDRVKGLICREKVVHGGAWEEDNLRLEPTILDGVTWEDAVMGEEIFGPVLPVLTFRETEQVLDTVNRRETPLALYVFARDKAFIRTVTGRCAFGGGCVNDCVIHLSTSELGFGGMGESGMGAYHGKTGFDTFTHYKSIMDKKTWLDLPMRYQPYRKPFLRLVRMLLK